MATNERNWQRINSGSFEPGMVYGLTISGVICAQYLLLFPNENHVAGRPGFDEGDLLYWSKFNSWTIYRIYEKIHEKKIGRVAFPKNSAHWILAPNMNETTNE